jgi:hypothetical protein
MDRDARVYACDAWAYIVWRCLHRVSRWGRSRVNFLQTCCCCCLSSSSVCGLCLSSSGASQPPPATSYRRSSDCTRARRLSFAGSDSSPPPVMSAAQLANLSLASKSKKKKKVVVKVGMVGDSQIGKVSRTWTASQLSETAGEQSRENVPAISLSSIRESHLAFCDRLLTGSFVGRSLSSLSSRPL